MPKNMLVDTANITVKAGKGGDGKVSFRREKFIPRGGPDGGDGGNGGNVYLVADSNMATLMDFRSKPNYDAEVGEMGSYRRMHGKGGEDLFVKVPLGTLIFEKRKDEEVLIGDMNEHGKELLVATGGRGGKGNDRFKSSRNRTPMQFTHGTPGEERALRLEVKMIADVGLVGFPNAGKSTLINHLAGTNAKVASYPFTTLSPNLGVCDLKDGSKIIIADVPGLITGASEGKGLGGEFLRHIERTRLIIHMIDPFSADAEDMVESSFKAYDAIRKELDEFGKELTKKQEIVAINKLDIFEVKEAFEDIKKAFKKERGIDVIGISAFTGDNLELLKEIMVTKLAELPKTVEFETRKTVKVYTINDLPNKRLIFREN